MTMGAQRAEAQPEAGTTETVHDWIGQPEASSYSEPEAPEYGFPE